MCMYALGQVVDWWMFGATGDIQAIGFHLGDWCDEETRIGTASLAVMGQRTCLTPATVKSCLDEAVALGLLECHGWTRIHGEMVGRFSFPNLSHRIQEFTPGQEA